MFDLKQANSKTFAVQFYWQQLHETKYIIIMLQIGQSLNMSVY